MEYPTVIVTGASRGLGAAVARILAQMGARVVITARSEDDLAAVASDIRAAGGEAEVVAGDIRAADVCDRLVRMALDRFGRLDAVVNNAGTLEPLMPIAEAEAGDWAHLFAVNVIAPVLLTRAALPALRERQGRVINVSSGAAVRPKGAWAAYCASKAALNQMTASFALEEPAITALAVAPGMVDTEMQAVIRAQGKGKMSDADYQRFVGAYERDELPAPEVPGRALAVLALYALPEWSGEFVYWDEDRVGDLVRQHAGA